MSNLLCQKCGLPPDLCVCDELEKIEPEKKVTIKKRGRQKKIDKDHSDSFGTSFYDVKKDEFIIFSQQDIDLSIKIPGIVLKRLCQQRENTVYGYEHHIDNDKIREMRKDPEADPKCPYYRFYDVLCQHPHSTSEHFCDFEKCRYDLTDIVEIMVRGYKKAGMGGLPQDIKHFGKECGLKYVGGVDVPPDESRILFLIKDEEDEE